jgi:hypothetical protein
VNREPTVIRLLLGMILFAVVACAPALSRPVSPAAAAEPAPPRRDALQKGIDYAGWYRGAYQRPDSDESLARLAATGADWVGLVATGYQNTIASTSITWDSPRTPSDADLIHAIATAHRLGLKVMLKPHVDLALDPDHWRGNIGDVFTTDEEWRAWFASYRSGILHLADVARDNGVEELCVGTELVGTSHRTTEWREVIRLVRQQFGGKLTYASNHDGEETSIRWWDAVDFIGVDAYYTLSAAPSPSVDEIKRAWVDRGYVARLQGLAGDFHRPILFTEIGYRSVDGAVAQPFVSRPDDRSNDAAQANAYEAAIETFRDRSWFAGFYWWAWPATLISESGVAIDWTPMGKLAESQLTGYYHAPTP